MFNKSDIDYLFYDITNRAIDKVSVPQRKRQNALKKSLSDALVLEKSPVFSTGKIIENYSTSLT